MCGSGSFRQQNIIDIEGIHLFVIQWELNYSNFRAISSNNSHNSLSFPTIIQQLGDDDWGNRYQENLHKHGVCTKHIDRVAGQNTGIAQINVAENGDNQIVMVPGANNSLSSTDVENVDELLKSSKVRMGKK